MRDFFWRFGQWLLLCLVPVCAGYLFYTQVYRIHGPRVASVDDRLPALFHASSPVFWGWVFGLGASAVGVAAWAVLRWRAWRRVVVEDEAAPADDAAALEAYWDEILARLRPAAGTSYYLALAPAWESAAALLTASGLSPEDASPSDPSAPLRAFSTEEGLVTWCGGRVPTSVAFVNGAMQRLAPGPSPLRGIVVLVPADKFEGGSIQNLVASVRAGVRAAFQDTSIRCPVYVVTSGMEAVPGFLEFARRMSPELRARGRCGFSLPEDAPLTFDRIAAEYSRFERWYDVSMFDLIALEPLATAGNFALYSLSRWWPRSRRRLLDMLDAIATACDEPVDLLGCYFVAAGLEPDDHAYAAGVVRGRIMGDPNSVRWSRHALDEDRAHRRSARLVGSAGAAACLLVWAYVLWLGSLGFVGWGWLVSMAAVWVRVQRRIIRSGRPGRTGFTTAGK